MYLRIPYAKKQRRGLRPHYVSPGTQSLAILVQPIGSSAPSPTPMPAQIFNVASPQCKTTPYGKQCQFNVKVMPGQDTFSLGTFSQANAGEGVISSVKMTFANPASKGQPNVIVVPAATQAPIETLSLAPLDGAGYEILEPSPGPGATYVPFANTITLSVAPGRRKNVVER